MLSAGFLCVGFLVTAFGTVTSSAASRPVRAPAELPPIITAPPPGARLAWRAPIGAAGDYVLPVSAGTLVVAASGPSDGTGARGRLVGLDAATGRRRWQRDLGAAPFLPLAAGRSLYVGATDGSIVALDAATGRIRWRQSTDLVPVRVIARDGMLYAASADPDEYLSGIGFVFGHERLRGQVIALDARTGEERWRFRVPGPSRYMQIHLGLGGGRLFVGSFDGLGHGRTSGLWALRAATGRVLWRRPSGFVGSAIAVRRRLVYVQANAPRAGLQARSATTGRVRWIRPGSYFWPVFAGNLIFGGPSAHELEAIDARNGHLRWRTFVGENNVLPLVRAGVVYFASLGRIIQARRAGTGRLIWRAQLPAGALALGRDRLYVGASGGTLVALSFGG
jgi:outer membrane protein assembly factor BamB